MVYKSNLSLIWPLNFKNVTQFVPSCQSQEVFSQNSLCYDKFIQFVSRSSGITQRVVNAGGSSYHRYVGLRLLFRPRYLKNKLNGLKCNFIKHLILPEKESFSEISQKLPDGFAVSDLYPKVLFCFEEGSWKKGSVDGRSVKWFWQRHQSPRTLFCVSLMIIFDQKLQRLSGILTRFLGSPVSQLFGVPPLHPKILSHRRINPTLECYSNCAWTSFLSKNVKLYSTYFPLKTQLESALKLETLRRLYTECQSLFLDLYSRKRSLGLCTSLASDSWTSWF